MKQQRISSRLNRREGQLQAALLYFEYLSFSEEDVEKREIYSHLADESRREIANSQTHNNAA